MSKYKFCEGCEFRSNDTCPSGYNPYDGEKCPPVKHDKFMALEKRKRVGMVKPRRQKPGW